MILTKLKAAGFSALAAGVLIAGALTVGAQAPAPSPLATTPAIAQAAPDEPMATRVRERTADPTDAIQKLLAEAKDRQAAGDAKGARQVLRKLHAVVFEWEDQLADGAVMPPRAARTIEARPSLTPPAVQVPTPAPRSIPRPGDGDLELRMRRLEDKLDKLIKAMGERQAN